MPINLFSSQNIPIKYLFDAAGYNNEDELSLNLLIGEFMSERGLKDEIPILTNLLKFQSSFPENENLNNILINSINFRKCTIWFLLLQMELILSSS